MRSLRIAELLVSVFCVLSAATPITSQPVSIYLSKDASLKIGYPEGLEYPAIDESSSVLSAVITRSMPDSEGYIFLIPYRPPTTIQDSRQFAGLAIDQLGRQCRRV